MKKTMRNAAGFFLTAILCVLALCGTGQAFAIADPSIFDQVFVNTINQILDEEVADDTVVSAQKELIFDINLEELGYIYTFTANNTEGYAILIDDNGFIDATEVYMDADSPYDGYTGTPIYVQAMIYWVCNGDDFTDTETGLLVAQEVLEFYAETAYYGSSTSWAETEYVYYTYRSVNELKFNNGNYPLYHACVSGLTNYCAPIAGANIIGWYDRYSPNLIANWDAAYEFFNTGVYFYNTHDSNVDPVITTLYSDMNTNNPNPGTTINGFKTGLQAYVTRKGYSLTYTSCMSGTNFNYGTAKTQMGLGRPLAMFLDTYNFLSISTSTGYDYINTVYDSLTHVVVGFGYLDVTYTLNNNTTRNDNYIAISAGLPTRKKGFLNINKGTIIDDVYAVNIY